jgi:tRNA(fMet)-specific endonuclease VapC
VAGTPCSLSTKRRDHLSLAYQSLADTVLFLARFRILAFPEPAVERYARLAASKFNVRKMDLRIAAIALEYDAVVVTRNLRDFQRVPGLPVEDWSTQSPPRR